LGRRDPSEFALEGRSITAQGKGVLAAALGYVTLIIVQTQGVALGCYALPFQGEHKVNNVYPFYANPPTQ